MICLIVGCRPIIYWLIIVVNERELKKRAMFHNIPSIRRCPHIFLCIQKSLPAVYNIGMVNRRKNAVKGSKRGQLRIRVQLIRVGY